MSFLFPNEGATLAREFPTMQPMSDGSDRDWQLRAWMRHKRKKQAHLVSDLGWTRGRASKVYNGSLPYRRDVVNQLADWLGIKPYELFLAPDEAEALHRLREAARTITEGEKNGPGDSDQSGSQSAIGGRATG